MAITDVLILPADVTLVPVQDLPSSVRLHFEAEEGDYALSRPHSRFSSQIVDARAAELLNYFREPRTIAHAVIGYARKAHRDPEETLAEAYPLLQSLFQTGFLVPDDSEAARQIRPSLEVGARFGSTEVLSCVQALDDTELYRVTTPEGSPAALKILRPRADASRLRMFERELAILTHLNGSVSPRLLCSGIESETRYLLTEWCSGEDCGRVAAGLRNAGTEGRRLLLDLCISILDRYAQLHALGIIHSDIHPRNVLVDNAQRITIIDFGYGRIWEDESEHTRADRAGVPFFFEPEYAQALRRGDGSFASSLRGEQYALAALCYLLMTGEHYLDFSLERPELLRQIIEDVPLDFSERGADPWPEAERVLAKALRKDPEDRFSSVAEFAARLRSIETPTNEHLSLGSRAGATPPATAMILDRVLESVAAGNQLFTNGLNIGPTVSVTFGAAGIAYGLYRIACARDDAQLLALADLWATRAARMSERSDAFYCEDIDITERVVGHISPFHTVSGVYVVRALIANAMADSAGCVASIQSFMEAVSAHPCDNLDVTLGRSGVLLSSAWLLEACSGNINVDRKVLVGFGSRVLEEVWHRVERFASIRECREIEYAGVAHGWGGILYAVLNWCRVSGTDVPGNFEDRLNQLASLGDEIGRRMRWKWSVRPGTQGSVGDYMPGWCNGSAGYVFLWTLAERMFKGGSYGQLSVKAGNDAWESPGQIGNLCCGYAGQAYALLNLYKCTGDDAWLHRAKLLAQRAARSIEEMPSEGAYGQLKARPNSLYKGEFGIAVLAAELEKPRFAAMPFFEGQT